MGEGALKVVSLSQKRVASLAVEGCCGADSGMGARQRGFLLGGWSYGCWRLVLP
jgi:hypothetical protein